jgi:hypothetical protein
MIIDKQIAVIQFFQFPNQIMILKILLDSCFEILLEVLK